MNRETQALHVAPYPKLQSKLPDIGTTIFSVISALAADHGAINLGQGFPDFPCDPNLIDAVHRAMLDGHNQYPPMPGVAALRAAIAVMVLRLHGRAVEPQTEITVTAGATQAIATAILSIVRPGDEVIVLEPCYDCYVPMVELCGGVATRVPLMPDTYRPNFQRIAEAITPRTRAVVINSPHNPSATVWRESDMLMLQELLADTDVLVISDEVYEHMVFDGRAHQSVSRFKALADRSFVVSSFGKTFHVTGWKIGYVVAPAELMQEFRKAHQFNVFTVNAPAQCGIAEHLLEPHRYENLASFYQSKRDFFSHGLLASRLRLLPSEGSYFQCVDYSDVSTLPDTSFCEWLISEIGVAAIPVSAFYRNGSDRKVIRFCFAKNGATLQSAVAKLRSI